MKIKAIYFLKALLWKAMILSVLFLGACMGFQEDPRDSGYEIRTPAEYRRLVTAIQAGKTATLEGEGTEGVFVEGRTTILGAYRIARHETTWELWKEVLDWARQNGYSIANEGREGGGEAAAGEPLPVAGVSWRDALVWCNAYSELSGLEPVYYTADGTTVLRSSESNGAPETSNGTDADQALAKRKKNGFRLPLESEWEYAARGGATDEADWNSPYAGDGSLEELGWHAGHGTQPGGTQTATRVGLFDMSGNVAEWCWDWFDGENPISQETPPDGAESPDSLGGRVIRGGSWKSAADDCGVKARDSCPPLSSRDDLGFRVVRSIPDTGADVPAGDYLPALVGTRWIWDSPWGMRIIIFDTEDHAVFDDYGTEYEESYTYDPASGTGRITGGYPAGDFQLRNDNKLMFFPDYKNYGHSAEFYFTEEE
jgi:formylglycine-generating enzyme required for sulfatase activity